MTNSETPRTDLRFSRYVISLEHTNKPTFSRISYRTCTRACLTN